jgi:hypothetical protein
MVSQRDARNAAGEVADDYIDAEDPNDILAEQLVSDETFGAIAVAYDQLRIERYYGDLSDAIDTPLSDSMGTLEDALEARATEVLEEEVDA